MGSTNEIASTIRTIVEARMTKLVRELYVALLKNGDRVIEVEYHPTKHISYIKLALRQ